MSLAYNDVPFLLNWNSTVVMRGKEETLTVHNVPHAPPQQEALHIAQV